MKLYQKPVMEIVELEKVDVLTCSKGKCSDNTHISHSQCYEQCGCSYQAE